MYILKYSLLFIILFFQTLASFGQNEKQNPKKPANSFKKISKPTLILEKPIFEKDSVRTELLNLPDTLHTLPPDTNNVNSVRTIPVSNNIKHIIDYTARDSIFLDVKDQKMYLYGKSKIVYDKITLEAERIDLDWTKNTIEANYELDSVGKKIGKPVYSENQDIYETNHIVYNIKTKKAIIQGAITEQDGAFMHGDKVKKNELDELFIKESKYTTCNLEDPHFYIRSKKLKVILNNKIMSGPFNLYFGKIPTPLWFPFGMFPQPKKKASGIIIPGYGEDPIRGFFLRNGGYYLNISDYLDLKITGELYSKGSFGLQSVSRYVKRYKYSGSLNLRFNKTVNTNFDDNSFSRDFWINWSHNTQSVGTGRFSASVSGGVSSYNQNANQVSRNFNQSINTQFSSNISYSKIFKGTPFNMAINLRHNQNIQTKIINFTLPDISLNATRIYPFKKLTKSTNNLLSKFGFSYSMSAKNDISNAPISSPSFNIVNKGSLDANVISFNANNLKVLFNRAKNGMRHTIPISTSFNLLKFFTISPNFNYTELWYPKELKYTYVPQEDGVRIDTLKKFSRTGFWNTGASLNTRIYGTYFFSGKKIQAIRHVITPSIGFSYRPDFGEDKYGNFQTVQINKKGDTRVLSKYERFAYGSPSRGKSSSLSLSITNNIEMKVKAKEKDNESEFKKIQLFDNISLSTSYNLAADSFKLADIRLSARTSVFKNTISLNFSSTFDPYIYILDSINQLSNGENRIFQHRIDKFAWNNGQVLGKLKNGNISVNLNLKGKNRGKSDTSSKNKNNPEFESDQPKNDFENDEDSAIKQTSAYDALDPNLYVDFNIPWTLRVNYSFNYSKIGFNNSNITQSLNFNGNISITRKTKIGFNSGYDLKNKEFTVTRINLSRDLHCWVLNLNWVPFGLRQEYFIELKVVSSLLNDLKIDKKRRSSNNSFSGFR